MEGGQQAITAKALKEEVAPKSCGDPPIEEQKQDCLDVQQLETSNELRTGRESGGSNEGVDEPFPDEGLRAWLVVLGAFWTVFCGFGICGGVGAFQSLYRDTILSDYTESEVAWITSVQAFFTFARSLLTGSLFDKYGHKPLVATGGFLMVLGFCMLSLSTRYYQIFLCHVLLIAGGTNLLFIVPLAIVGQWFDKNRGLAFGIMSCGSSFGASVWPLVLANLPNRVGFARTCRIIALICLFCTAAAYLLLKTRLKREPKGAFLYLGAFRSFEYTMMVFGFAIWSFGYFNFQTFIGTYGQAQSLGAIAPYLLITTSALSAIGRLATGVVADRFGKYNTVIIGNFAVALFFWVWLGCRDTASCFILAVGVGISGGAFISLQAPLVTMTGPNMNLGGAMLGQALFVQSFVMLMSSPIAGAMLGRGSLDDKRQRFVGPIILCASMMTLALGLVVLARLRRSRRLRSKV